MDITVETIINFILEPEFKGLFLYIKAIFIFVSILLMLGVVFLTLKTNWLNRRITEDLVEFSTFKPFISKEDYKTWEKIRRRIETGRESDYKLAIIEADNLLENFLGKMGCKGETMEERMEQAKSIITFDLSFIQEAHKQRNNIVYDPDYKLTFEEAKKTLDIYEEFFRNTEMF